MLTACIIGLLLQYNQFLIANVKAYVSPSESQPESIIIDPNADVPVGPENKMIIPKINVDAPIVLNVGSSAKQQLDAMSNGTQAQVRCLVKLEMQYSQLILVATGRIVGRINLSSCSLSDSLMMMLFI